ncbi:TIGR01777 family oxidoreductase [Alkalihalobacillus trypoxylicola]|uniref:Epimerase n=1 Tax=Alkalihalobacillus trypoxylicola TaxID=519424 RepID=A0A162EZF2_9BACI|nr:TIGR01777 family oxidoreductase [Alkalihalobacillus trypoxylicola]KYG34104.1 epimerase [Alkalihalobacillus trypoxylicola]
MKGKIVMAGGTGFTGEYFKKKFEEEGYQVIIISRNPSYINWDHTSKIKEAIEGSELLLNLAGKSVNCRYHKKNRDEIFQSRTETTKLLGECVLSCQTPPKLWINASTATIYRHSDDQAMTEENGEIGEGFSVEVAKAWEKSFFSFSLPTTRQIALRISIVLGKNGGVMTPYRNLAKYGLGGKQGNGKQMFSWIHIEDLYQVIRFLMEKKDATGIYNCAAPNPINNKEFMKAVRNMENRKRGLPAYRWMLELGAIFLRTETELLLKSRWVVPDRLVNEGFPFTYPTIEQALDEIKH